MPPIQHRVLRGTVLFTLLGAAGCNDSPMQPHPAVPTGAEIQRASSQTTLSGHAADSLVSVLETFWARQGHPEYREARLTWRKVNGVPVGTPPDVLGPTVRTARTARTSPNADLADGAGGTEKPPARIVSHYEKLYFGRDDQYAHIPTAVNGEMTFIGDFGDIQLGSLTITRNNGAQFFISGRIAAGAGQLLNCADAVFSTCDNRKFLQGVMTLQNAPTCDARGSGSVNYSASNVNSSGGVSLLGSSTPTAADGSVSANGSIDGTASACEPPPQPPKSDGGEDIGGNGTGQGADGTTGGTSGVAPPPETWPPPPSYPATPTGPVGWDCGGVTMSQLIGDQTVFLAEAYVCRPIYYY